MAVPHCKQRLPQAALLIPPAACLLQERAAKEHDAAAVTQLRMIGFQEQITMLQEELTKLAPEAAVLTHQRDTLQSEVGSSTSPQRGWPGQPACHPGACSASALSWIRCDSIAAVHLTSHLLQLPIRQQSPSTSTASTLM